MSILQEKINPLNLIGQRKLNYMPVHFTVFKLPVQRVIGINSQIEIINRWVYQNLNSRYCIRKKYDLNSERILTEFWEIGFEDPRELTMLCLGCPHINQ